MKLRYYMRGLGIGILVTAVLMGVTMHGKEEKLTDAQIIERAKDLGMEEKYGSSVLSETVSDNDTDHLNQTITENESNAEKDKDTDQIVLENQDSEIQKTENQDTKDKDPMVSDDVGSKLTDHTDDKLAEVKKEDATQNKADSQPEDSKNDMTDQKTDDVNKNENIEKTEIQITVNSGDGSETVARKLKDAGLIEDAKAYDRYLCANGFDKKICTGTHVISVGASDEEIAKIITSKP